MQDYTKNHTILSKINLLLPDDAASVNLNDIQFLNSETNEAQLARASGNFNANDFTFQSSDMHDKEEEKKKKNERRISIFSVDTESPFSLFKAAFAAITSHYTPAIQAASNVITFCKKDEDDEYLYGTTQVSEEIYAVLQEDHAWLSQELAEYEQETDPAKRAQMAREINDLADWMGIMVELDTENGCEVCGYDLDRIVKMRANAMQQGISLSPYNREIDVYYDRLLLGTSTRGIKVQIADVLPDENPSETKISGQHLSVEAKGANAPALHLH